MEIAFICAGSYPRGARSVQKLLTSRKEQKLQTPVLKSKSSSIASFRLSSVLLSSWNKRSSSSGLTSKLLIQATSSQQSGPSRGAGSTITHCSISRRRCSVSLRVALALHRVDPQTVKEPQIATSASDRSHSSCGWRSSDVHLQSFLIEPEMDDLWLPLIFCSPALFLSVWPSTLRLDVQFFHSRLLSGAFYWAHWTYCPRSTLDERRNTLNQI